MKSLSDLWDSILARLSGELSDMTIKTWFDEITVVTMEDSALVLHCSNPFKKNTVEARFLPHIKAALKDIFSTDLEVKILSDEQLAAYHGVAPDRPGNLFDSDAFTFETYVVGPQNKLAYAAAKAVAEKPAEGFNPLFIYGESGLGKTHLLYAIAHLMRSRRPESRIVYIKGDDFTNELVSSIRENRNAEFREKYRQADILLVDDLTKMEPKAVYFEGTLVAENNVTEGFIAGRLTRELLAGVPDLASRTVMTCGPAPYMDWVEQEVKALGVTRFFKEKFFTPVAEAATSGLKFTKLQPAREFYAPVGTTLLEALESNNVPVVAACRAGVCGCCKTKVVSGEYTVSSTMTLTDAEIAEGYVLACSCHPQGDLVLA